MPPISSSYSRFARGKDMCVIGGSAMQYCVTNSSYRDTGDPATSERLNRVGSNPSTGPSNRLSGSTPPPL